MTITKKDRTAYNSQKGHAKDETSHLIIRLKNGSTGGKQPAITTSADVANKTTSWLAITTQDRVRVWKHLPLHCREKFANEQ